MKGYDSSIRAWGLRRNQRQAPLILYGERLEEVCLYGSYARGDFTEDSDIDVLIVLRGEVKPGAEITNLSPVLSRIYASAMGLFLLFSPFRRKRIQLATPLLWSVCEGRG